MRPYRVLLTLTTIAAMPSLSACGGCDHASDAPPPVASPSAPNPPAPGSPASTSTVPVVRDRNGRYALFRPIQVRVGDALTVDSSATTTGKITRLGANGERTPIADVLDVLHAIWVETVTEVDADGHPTRYSVRIPAWSRRREGQRDQTLTGAVVTVAGSGAARQWTFVEQRADPTDEARNWLDEHFGARGASDQDWLRILLPDEPVAIGETWTPSPERLATAMTAAGMAVDRSRLGTSATFEGIEQGIARIAFKGDFALSTVPNVDVAWTTGGTLAFEGDIGVTLEPAPLALRTLHRKGTLVGDAIVDGTTVSYDLKIDETRRATPGEPPEKPHP